MRTFIAIEPTATLRREIGRLGRELGGQFPGVRWSSPENIHLTLRFLGDIEPDSLTSLNEAVSAAATGCGKLDLRVTGLGWFGPARNPRVIWLGLNDNPGLSALASRLEKELESAGFGRADKPFKAHLTLARIKKPLPRPPNRAEVDRIVARDWPDWEADRVEVIKSTLTTQGPVYEVLSSVSLD